MKGLKMTRKEQPLTQRAISTVHYGLPGVGKTTTGFTFPKPCLHFDFDKGVNRAYQALRPDSAEITNYGEFQDYIMSDQFAKDVAEAGYKTCIVDTVGTMLDDTIAPWLIGKDPKNARAGGLSLQGWGALGSTFNLFRSRIRGLGMELHMICHAKQDDEKRYILAVKGGSVDIIYRSADLIGLIYVKGDDRVAVYSPRHDNVCKDTGRIGEIVIPDPEKQFEAYRVFGETITDKCKTKMVEESHAQVEAQEAIKQYLESIDNASKAADFDAIISGLAEEPNQVIKAQVRNKLSEALKDKKFYYDTEAGKVKKKTAKAQNGAEEASKEEAPKEKADADA